MAVKQKDGQVLVRVTLRLRDDQVRALKRAAAEYPLQGVGQVTNSTVVGDLIDTHLLKAA